MSHSKHTKRGYSIYIEKWKPSVKKYINTCSLCGCQGYSPVIEEEGIRDDVAARELIKTLPKMEIDEFGRCSDCRRLQEGSVGNEE